MRPQKPKLDKIYAVRVSETEHEKIKTLPWSSRKIIRLKLRALLTDELAKV